MQSKHPLYLSLLAGLCLGAAGCGAGAHMLDAPGPELRIVAFADSDWDSRDLEVSLEPSSAGPVVTLRSEALALPARTVLLELQFDPALQAAQPTLHAPAGALSLLATSRPGVAALGIVMPPGREVAPGELLQFTLQPADAAARSASDAPQSKYGQVTDLSCALDGGGLRLDWGYRNDGDCDQNSEVLVSDLTALASRLFETTNDGEQDAIDVVLDVDGNTEINAADLTGIGINYRARVSGYKIYQADGLDPETAHTALAGTVDFPVGTANPRTRRPFSLTLDGTHLGPGKFYFVRPLDDLSGNEGPASNVVSGDLTPPVPLRFEVPPAGQQNPDTAAALAPSLVLMPAIADVSAAGAPAIVYLRAGGGGPGVTTLTLARYSDGTWITEDISGGVNYSAPQACFTGTAGLVLAFDTAAQAMRLLRFDAQWASAGPPETVQTVAAGSIPIASDADFDAAAGRLGLVHAYTSPGGASVLFSEYDGTAWTNTPVYTGAAAGEIIGGASFRYDGQGGAPWCAYTSGTVAADLANVTFSIDTQLNVGRLSGGAWDMSPVAYPDSPLSVDLGIAGDGHMRLALNAARDYNLNIPTVGSFNLSLQFDGAVGDYNGAGFDFAKPYASNASLVFIGGFPPTGVGLKLDLATGAHCVGPDGVIYALNAGQVDFDLNFTPTGGSLAPDSKFYSAGAGGYGAGTFFTGTAGRSYSWAQASTGGLATAYLEGVALDSSNLGNLSTSALASPLLYWTP